MPTNVSSRITLISLVLWASLSLIFPRVPPSLFWFLHPMESISVRPALKPGIDMVGGTSLVYEIKPPGEGHSSNLAEEVMQSLKKRVDPDGVRNLIWRPQGNRLEIQMPSSPNGKQAKALREEFADTQTELEKTNIRQGEVKHAVETLTGTPRAEKLKELAAGSVRRAEILGGLSTRYDQVKGALQDKNAAKQAEYQLEYEKLYDQLNETNLPVGDLQRILDLPKTELRDKELAKLKERFADFPARLAAIDRFTRTYAQFAQIRGEIDDASELKRLLRGSGVIEFHILANDIPVQEYQAAVERLQRRGPRHQSGDLVRWYEVERSEETIARVERVSAELSRTTDPREREILIKANSDGNETVEGLFKSLLSVADDPIARKPILKQIEDSLLMGHELEDYGGKKWVLAHVSPDQSLAQREGQSRWALERAYPILESGERQVGFSFDTQGAMRFSELTGNNIGKPLAIVLDDKVISAPRINSQISRSGVITGGGKGGFSMGELNYLVNTLNAGALPAQLTEEPISEQTVGSQIGEDNLRRGLYSCYFGLVVVAVFLIGYYYLAGVVAMVAVLMNMVLILGAMAGLNASFTLPGIAGIVLTIGMAVDANVLIFERLREEQLRGLSLRMALRNAYDRAWYAIFDSNVTTAITAAALYFFGSEEVRGFGLTLLLGILSSMFTALFVTKTIFAILVDRFGVQHLGSLPLTYPKWDKMLKPNMDWMGKAWIFYAFSTVFIVIGLTLFTIKWVKGQMLDIEFASGTAVQFELKAQTPIDEVRQIMTDMSRDKPQALPSPNVVQIGDNGRTYEVITPNQVVPEVKGAILTALGDKLDIARESKFQAMDKPAAAAMGDVLFPIEQSTSVIAGQAPRDLQKHIGGVAIELRNLEPPLSPAEISRRIEQQRLQPQVGSGSAKRYSRVSVEGTSDGKGAIVMASDPDIPYDAIDPIKQQQWMDELAGPTWNLVRDAIGKPADLQKVTSFNPQIAGEAQQKAFIALSVSIVAIMAYIWIRFGNLTYGTATVVALLHDTLFTLAAVGVAHYIGNTWLGDALLIEPFRINLNLVAAILTVMGYSMNDTVVVFDRIRENRGKFGHVDRNIINDSINQTLSRTLLTGGTTILTIFVMYTWGGSGIHGFTFALLVGIVVGTYSSIAIASPILLLGKATEQAPGDKRPETPGRRQFQGA